MTSAEHLNSPADAPIRYIKLGRGGAYTARSLDAGELHIGHHRVPHELALQGDKEAIVKHLVAQGRSPGKARDFAREVLEFYQLGPEALWFTFVDGQLWWTHAEPEVTWLGEDHAPNEKPHGVRFRRTIGRWRNTDANGRPLPVKALSTKLTKVAAYRQTLCSIEPEAADYLRRKLAGEEEPTVSAALEAKRSMIAAAERLITGLHWADFETLVDMILARGGWHRISALGGSMKDADLIVEQPVTQETALVQVKSAATQSVLDDYIGRFDETGKYSRLIFVCHSPRGALEAPNREDVIIWARSSLADTAVRHGLIDWLIGRAG
jgi:hypothetical protein